MVSSMHDKGSTTGAKAKDAEWFSEDLVSGLEDEKMINYILQVSVSITNAVIEVTLDGGTTWTKLNSGTAITVGLLHQFDIFAKSTDLLNFRASNVNGTTLDYCYVIGALNN